jgi:hypothetical protein
MGGKFALGVAVAFLGFASMAAQGADVYLVNADGKVWMNGKYEDDSSASPKCQAVGVACTQQLRGIQVVDADGVQYSNGGRATISIPFKIQAVAMTAVGLEPYILDGSKGEVWRYFREGPGKGAWGQEKGASDPFHRKAVDLAVAGPSEDKAARKVYILLADGRVLLDGREATDLGPGPNMMNKPSGISVADGAVYVLDGANGKVYKNGKQDAALSTGVLVPSVGFDVKDGKSYILTRDGTVYVNGKRDAAVSAEVTSVFVGICVK